MSTETVGPVMVDRPTQDIAVVKINRPQARNALNVEAVAALGKTVAELDDDQAVRVIVLVGEGGNFSAGSDIKELAGGGLQCLRNTDRLRGWAQIESVRKPFIAAVEGMALGAGFELALTADFIVSGPSARFGLPELRIGLMPGDGGTQRLARVVGQAAALRMILTGEPIDAATAASLGLAELAPEGALSTALKIAERIAANAPIATTLAKQAVRAGNDASLATGLSLEGKALELAFATQDCAEGLRAFIEKRAPVFKGS